MKEPTAHLIAALRQPLLRPVSSLWRCREAKRIKQAHILATPWHLGRRPIHIAPSHTRLVQQTDRRQLADRHFSESHLHMKQAYLLLASERRVLNVVLDDDPDAIRRAIGYQTIAHGTTFQTEDQLIVSADELGGVPQDRFWAAGVPFAFHGNALLVGIDPLTGDTASRPQMKIDQFQRLITLGTPSHGGRLPMLVPEALEEANPREGR
jgi:hypothetical protein